jgi:hypothetical protein
MKPVDKWEWMGVILAIGGVITPFILYFGGFGDRSKRTGSDCYVEWDGRSNQEYCD